MHWGMDWHSGWLWGMHLGWWAFWIVTAVILWVAVTRSAAPSTHRAEAPLDLLKRRYAEGAMTTDEYEERKARLTDSEPAAR